MIEATNKFAADQVKATALPVSVYPNSNTYRAAVKNTSWDVLDDGMITQIHNYIELKAWR
jgi:hypothetical protein